MRSLMTLGVGLAGVLALGMGCGSGSAGPAGPAGANGTNGTNGNAGPAGSTGPAGPAGNSSPSVSAMIPRVGVLDREFDAVVVGNETVFDNTTQVDLGTGVTVSKLQVASPTALFFHVAVDKAAPTGAHDLKVTGASAATVTGMLSVVPAMGVTVSAGATSQGSLAQVDLTDNDSTGFAVNVGNDVFQLQGGLFTMNACPPCNGGGVVYQTPGAARYVVALDPLAPAGAVQPIGVNAYFDQKNGDYAALTTFYSDPSAVTVTARAPTTVTLGTPIAGENISASLADNLYHVTTDGTAQLAQVTITNASGSQLNPLVWTIPTTGHFSDFLYATQGCTTCAPLVSTVPVGPVATDFYMVVMDSAFNGGQSNYGYSVTSQKVAATAIPASSTTHATVATAQSIGNAAPWVLTGNIANSSQTDVYLLSGLPAGAQFCTTQFNWSFTASSDVCVQIDESQNLDADVANDQQNHACPTNLGTGGQHGVNSTLCSAPPGITWAVAVWPRYQAQVPTGAYSFAFGY